MSEPDYETMLLQELVALYEQKVEAFKQRNRSINRLVDARRANTLDQKVQGRTARKKLMGAVQQEIRELGKIVKRRLAAEAGEVLGADKPCADDGH